MGYNVSSQPIRVKKSIGVVPQQSNLDQSLRVREILIYHAAYHGIGYVEREKLADQWLEEFGLAERKHDKVSYYSGGMGQRLMIARALMHQPDVLFLDEPTNRLDPQSRLFLWERIQKLKEQGTTILLTTHDMDEAEQLCDRIAIMDRGQILALDTAHELKKKIPGGTTLEIQIQIPGTDSYSNETEPRHTRILEALHSLPGVNKVDFHKKRSLTAGQQQIGTYFIHAQDAENLISSALHTLRQEDTELHDLHLSRPSLEDVFIYLTGRKLRA